MYTKDMNFFAKLSTRAYLIVVLTLALIVRLIFVLKANLWHDEAYTAMLVKFNFADIIDRAMRDVHPPLYHLLLNFWENVFGPSVLSLRGFSVLLGVLTVVVVYFLMRKLFSETTARIAGLLTALGPFLVRYSDEARMYALVALLVAFATYALVTALEKANQTKWKWWLIYAITIAAALYTQYYAIFIIPVHVAYAWWRFGNLKSLVRSKYWWGANLGAAALFVPWLPVIVDQTSRVQAGFWIPPMTHETIPNTFAQFIIYEAKYPFVFELVALLAFIGALAWIIQRSTSAVRANTLLLAGWLAIPIIGVCLISLKQPVYQDRYFTYGAVAFYALLAVIAVYLPWFKKHHWRSAIFVGVLSITFLVYGLTNIALQARHRMAEIGNYVSAEARPGDTIVSAELYTYFDFDYYNHSKLTTHLLSREPLSGYAESGLIYDKPEILIPALKDIKSEHVWVVGKTGEHDYFTTAIPHDWRLIERKEAGDSVVQLYQNPNAE